MSEKIRNRTIQTRKKTELTAVEKILHSLMAKLDMPEDTQAKANALSAWEEVAGNAAPHSHAFRFQGSTLIVEVDSSIWINELSMRKSEFMDRLERAVGERVVEDIRFQVKKKRRE